jgi:hypothetical protein
MKKKSFLSFGALLALLPASANAGSSPLSEITGVLPHSGGFFFNVVGQRASVPSCATVINRWVIDASTPQGQAMIAGLLTAYAAHKRVTVVGKNNCAVWPDTETVEHFQIED